MNEWKMNDEKPHVFTRNNFQNFASEEDKHLVHGLADDLVAEGAAVLGKLLKQVSKICTNLVFQFCRLSDISLPLLIQIFHSRSQLCY